MYYYYYDCPIGKLTIVANSDYLLKIDLKVQNYEDYNYYKSAIIEETCLQLDQYFQGQRKEFTIPIFFDTTPFFKKVYDALLKVEYGTTCTYQDIAIKCNCIKGARAVGMANNKNKIPIIIPCHRVIGKNQKLVGYAGGLNMKTYLLKLEGIDCELF